MLLLIAHIYDLGMDHPLTPLALNNRRQILSNFILIRHELEHLKLFPVTYILYVRIKITFSVFFVGHINVNEHKLTSII